MVTNSTVYYRNNRNTRKRVYQCPHCNYHTYNCKKVLSNHINSRHRIEANRPFQCTECTRGFAQKVHLVRHLECEHEITGDLRHMKISTLMYLITPTNISPKSKRTKARREYYLSHPVLKGRDIYNKLHEYCPGSFLKNHDLHYDRKNGFITFRKLALKEGFNIQDKLQITVNL